MGPHHTNASAPGEPLDMTCSPTLPEFPQEPLISPLVLGVAVVNFHHQVGPQVEWTHPESLMEDTQLITDLPFYALPDGSNRSDEDFCFFHVSSKFTRSDGAIFGVSCNRQVPVSELTVRPGLTRSTVQKAVVVLARAPVFQPVRAKLAIVTRVYFCQGDFDDRTLLIDFSHTLEQGLAAALRQSLKDSTDRMGAPTDLDPLGIGVDIPELNSSSQSSLPYLNTTLGMGTNLRRLVYEWKCHVLVLLKLLLLQKRVLFYGYPIETLCAAQYSLVACIPGLMTHLDDCAEAQACYPPLVPTGTLPLFTGDCTFIPYLPLQQLDALNAASWLVGTSNPILLNHSDIKIDAIVNLEDKTITCPCLDSNEPTLPPSSLNNTCSPSPSTSFRLSNAGLSPLATDPAALTQEGLHPFPPLTPLELQQALQLTTADRRWMEEEIIPAVTKDGEVSPDESPSLHFRGSDDWLRAQFQGYVTSVLTTVRAAEQVDSTRMGASLFGSAFPTPAPRMLSPLSSVAESTELLRLTTESNHPVSPHIASSPALSVAHFGRTFCLSMRTTPSYHLWKASTPPNEWDRAQHPFETRLSVLEGVSARLAATLDDPRAALGKSIAASGAALAAGTKGLRRFAATAINRHSMLSAENSPVSDEVDDLTRSWLLVDHTDARDSSRVSSPVSHQPTDSLPKPPAAARTAWDSVGGYFSAWNAASATAATTGHARPPVRKHASAPPRASSPKSTSADAIRPSITKSSMTTPRIRVRTRRSPSRMPEVNADPDSGT